MKKKAIKILSALIAALLSVPSTYASDLVVPVGVVVQGSSVEVMVAPSSVVVVDMVSETVSFEPGVYARYAQKFLGVRAPLLAKNSTAIISARITKHAEGERVMMANYASDEMFKIADDISELPVDRVSSEILPPEQAAQEAANEIFRLRKLKRDILSGELGEGFFAGGLQSALREIDQLESAYTELFMGRTDRTTDSKSFSVSIANGETRHVVCRLSKTNGIVDASDLSAEPVLLQITPSQSEKIVAPAMDEKSEIRKFRVADMSKCELFLGSKLLAQTTLLLFEFGYDLSYPIPRR